ncbi:hypothetical protein ABPG72_002360 [Tetrahymena utriculariae]
MKKMQLYILPVNNRVVFPYQTINIRIPETYQYDAKKFNSMIGVLPNLDPTLCKEKNIETIENFAKYGTILKITSEDRTFYTFTAGYQKNHREVRYYGAFAFGRFKVIDFDKTSPYYIANVELISDEIPPEIEKAVKADNTISNFRNLAKTYVEIVCKPEAVPPKKQLIENEQSINKLVFSVANYLDVQPEVKQAILQVNEIKERIKEICKILQSKNDELKLANELEKKVKKEMSNESQSRQLILRQQPPQHEIGGLNVSPEDEMSQLEIQIKQKQLPENVFSAVMREFKRLKSIRSQNAETNVIRTYIDTILELPWNETTQDTYDLKFAEEILNRDHSGLEKVKKRILEFLAVRSLKGNSKGTIICLCGPPGVGKTSLGKSIADSLGRKFERISLGGVRDEAEVRGHRRTYVGSLPGVIIQALRKCQSKNPVILLDEIDKINRDYRGDPSSALLEVLDPNQNSTFTDHYLALPFDLSNVMFIATANQLDTIQGPLLDRMEVIQIPGYTLDEKKEIAHKYLIPKQIEENGINQNVIDLYKESVDLIIKAYTREAGVRQLERNIGSVCRSVAVKYSIHKQSHKDKSILPEFQKVKITPDYVRDALGIEIYDEEEIKDRINSPGIAVGMAYTAVGGKTLIIEASMSQGSGKINLTGQLGDVMKESVQTAIGWIKSNWQNIQFMMKDPNIFKAEKVFDNIDIHVHFPAAATPKDGPSAGITITTALLSLLSMRKIRNDIAMTGEITLKGLVLPVGGIKEKVLAAYANGIKTIILPYKNRKDTEDITPEIKKNIDFKFVKNIFEVIDIAFDEQEELSILKAKFEADQMNKQSKL